MELKRRSEGHHPLGASSLNRTFMELKLSALDLARSALGLNRTFMELKQRERRIIEKLDAVLIVPLWN